MRLSCSSMKALLKKGLIGAGEPKLDRPMLITPCYYSYLDKDLNPIAHSLFILFFKKEKESSNVIYYTNILLISHKANVTISNSY
jgi:hypothetical protein